MEKTDFIALLTNSASILKKKNKKLEMNYPLQLSTKSVIPINLLLFDP